jgi:hypothetical protein
MSMKRSARIAALLAVFTLVAATAATAATPRQIYKDWAANGRIDGHYSTRDLLAAQKDSTLQGYGAAGFAPTVQQKISSSTPTAASGVLGTNLAASSSPQSTLPFTGQNLLLLALAGIVLATLGMALRRSSRSER